MSLARQSNQTQQPGLFLKPARPVILPDFGTDLESEQESLREQAEMSLQLTPVSRTKEESLSKVFLYTVNLRSGGLNGTNYR